MERFGTVHPGPVRASVCRRVPHALALGLGMGAAACGGAGRTGGAPGDSVYIGVATSPTSRTGPSVRGVQLAIERLNAGRPAGQPPFALRMAPAEQPSQVAVAAFFRDDPAVIGVVGHEKSGETLEAAPVYSDFEGNGRRALVAITPTATNPGLTRVSPWIFRVCPTDIDRAGAIAQFLADSATDRRVALLYRNDLMGRGFRGALGARVRAAGGTVVENDPYIVGMTEYGAYAARIRQRGAPTVVMAGAAGESPEIVRALREAGVQARLIVHDDASYLARDPVVGPALRGVRYLTFYVPNEQGAGEEAWFVRTFRQRFGAPPDGRDAFSFEAATLIGSAVRAVGADRKKVRDWIALVGNGNPPMPGITGEIRFSDDRTAMGKRVWIREVNQ